MSKGLHRLKCLIFRRRFDFASGKEKGKDSRAKGRGSGRDRSGDDVRLPRSDSSDSSDSHSLARPIPSVRNGQLWAACEMRLAEAALLLRAFCVFLACLRFFRFISFLQLFFLLQDRLCVKGPRGQALGASSHPSDPAAPRRAPGSEPGSGTFRVAMNVSERLM